MITSFFEISEYKSQVTNNDLNLQVYSLVNPGLDLNFINIGLDTNYLIYIQD